VVFKRRDRRPILDVLLRFFWPKGGWGRAFYYVKHRLHRLPDTPQRIARGIFAGVYTTFTPFYGLHFIHAAALARVMNGNILAALLATFFGNPLTYLPIGIVSLKTGHFLLGNDFDHTSAEKISFVQKFVDAGHDLKANFINLFTGGTPDWANLIRFYDEVFFSVSDRRHHTGYHCINNFLYCICPPDPCLSKAQTRYIKGKAFGD